MTSQTIEIHQRGVLQIIKTCFNIYLTSRSKINEATAQGCLSQMLNGIFSKMEQKMVEFFNLYSNEKWFSKCLISIWFKALLHEQRNQYQEDINVNVLNNMEQENMFHGKNTSLFSFVLSYKLI